MKKLVIRTVTTTITDLTVELSDNDIELLDSLLRAGGEYSDVCNDFFCTHPLKVIKESSFSTPQFVEGVFEEKNGGIGKLYR